MVTAPVLAIAPTVAWPRYVRRLALGAGAKHGLFHLDEMSDLGALLRIRTDVQAHEPAD